MTDEQIIEMARQANLPSCLATHPKALKRFSELVTAKEREEFAVHAVDIARRAVAEEREACAKLCESESSNVAEHMFGKECAAAIRARGNT